MSRWAVTGLIALALVAGGCGTDAPGLEGDCVARFMWDGVEYAGIGAPKRPVIVAGSLGPSAMYGCPGDPRIDVLVVRLAGVDPSVAVGVRSDPGSDHFDLYGRRGYVVESERHPLHDAAYFRPRQPQAVPDGYRCSPPREMPVQVVDEQAESIPLRVTSDDPAAAEFLTAERVEGFVYLTVETRIRGAERRGIPYVAAGDRLRITLRECRPTPEAAPGSEGDRRLVVDELTLLS